MQACIGSAHIYAPIEDLKMECLQFFYTAEHIFHTTEPAAQSTLQRHISLSARSRNLPILHFARSWPTLIKRVGPSCSTCSFGSTHSVAQSCFGEILAGNDWVLLAHSDLLPLHQILLKSDITVLLFPDRPVDLSIVSCQCYHQDLPVHIFGKRCTWSSSSEQVTQKTYQPISQQLHLAQDMRNHPISWLLQHTTN